MDHTILVPRPCGRRKWPENEATCSHELPVNVVNLWYLLGRIPCTNYTVKKDVGIGLTNVKSLADLETAWADSNRKAERIADLEEVVDVQ